MNNEHTIFISVICVHFIELNIVLDYNICLDTNNYLNKYLNELAGILI